MGRIGSLPSVPEEYVGDVMATSWALANTDRDPRIVVRAEAGELATQCPSCHDRLLIDIVGTRTAQDAAYFRDALEAPVSSAMRHATQIAEDAALSTAAELLVTAPRRMVVVVDPRHRPRGILTSAQVLAAVKQYSRDQLSTASALQAAIPSEPVIPARARLDFALRVLTREDRDFVLVVDDAGALMGALRATERPRRPGESGLPT